MNNAFDIVSKHRKVQIITCLIALLGLFVPISLVEYALPVFGFARMLVAGYLGETVFRDNSPLWGIISTIGYLGILYEVWMGSAKKLANNSNDPALQSAFSALGWFVLVGWAIYPIGYMAIEGSGWLSGVLNPKSLDIIYNIGNAVNKIGFGLCQSCKAIL